MPPYFDPSHIQHVLQATDIVELIQNYIALKPRGKEMVGLCPFHDDKRPSFNVSPGKQIFKCFACGAGGNAITFLMRREQMTFPEAVKLLAEKAGVVLPQRQGTAPSRADRSQLEAINRWAARYFRSEYEHESIGLVAREYVQGRQITDEAARRFGLGWARPGWESLAHAGREQGIGVEHLVHLGLVIEKDSGRYYDRFRERLMFPVLDAMGRVIGFGGRALGDDPAKYMNSPESELFDKSKALYGIHAAKDELVRQRQAVVVEGYTDCIMAHQFGVTNVVATLGTALTTDHARILSRYVDRIVLLFDSDEAGQKAADRAIDIFFSQQMDVRLATVPEGKDPCDFLLLKGKEALESVIAEATEALEYKWRATLDRLEKSDSVSGRGRAIDEFLSLVAAGMNNKTIDPIRQGFVVNRVTKLIDVTADQVHLRLRRLGRRAGQTAVAAKSASQPERLEINSPDRRTVSEKQILEVLLNRPELFDTVQSVLPEPQSFVHPVLRDVADQIWPYYQSGQSGPLSEILAGCDRIALCDLMTDLAADGAARGNYQQTLLGALNNLSDLEQRQQREALRAAISESSGQYDPALQNAMLYQIQSREKTDPRRVGPIRK